MIQEKIHKIINKLETQNHFLVSAHLRADGDAVASVCFISSILSTLQKSFYAVLHDDVLDERYRFLDHFIDIHRGGRVDADFNPRNAIILDTPTFDRLGSVADKIRHLDDIILIDHHISNRNYPGISLVDVHRSSTCEILAEILKERPEWMSPAVATTLYTGIAFDTGRFRFSNTKASTLETAAWLVKHGARPDIIANHVFYNWTPLRVEIMGRVLSGLTLYSNNRIAIMQLDYDFFRDHSNGWKELEGFSNFGMAIQGVEVSAFLKELQPNHYKISLRSSRDCNVEKIARFFGGGGHAKAAGCEIKGHAKNIIPQLIERFESQLNKTED